MTKITTPSVTRMLRDYTKHKNQANTLFKDPTQLLTIKKLLDKFLRITAGQKKPDNSAEEMAHYLMGLRATPPECISEIASSDLLQPLLATSKDEISDILRTHRYFKTEDKDHTLNKLNLLRDKVDEHLSTFVPARNILPKMPTSSSDKPVTNGRKLWHKIMQNPQYQKKVKANLYARAQLLPSCNEPLTEQQQQRRDKIRDQQNELQQQLQQQWLPKYTATKDAAGNVMLRQQRANTAINNNDCYRLLKNKDPENGPRFIEQYITQDQRTAGGNKAVDGIRTNKHGQRVINSKTVIFKPLSSASTHQQQENLKKWQHELKSTINFNAQVGDRLSDLPALTTNKTFTYSEVTGQKLKDIRVITARKQPGCELDCLLRPKKNKLSPVTFIASLNQPANQQALSLRLRQNNMLLHAFSELSRQLDLMHQRKVFHRDIKPENLIANYKLNEEVNAAGFHKDEMQLKLIDWGFAEVDIPHKFCGTPLFLRLELIETLERLSTYKQLQAQQCRIATRLDQYALLMSFIDSISYIEAYFSCHVSFDIPDIKLNAGFISPGARLKLKILLQEYIQPQYLNPVMDFLSNPLTHQLKDGLQAIFRANLGAN